MTTKTQLKKRLEAVFTAWHDELAHEIATSGHSYEHLARIAETSSGFIYRLARQRGLRRQADAKAPTEVNNA